MVVIEEGFNLLYPTPFYKTKMESELCEKMSTWYLSTEDISKNTHDNILLKNDPIIDTFKTLIAEKFSEFFDLYFGENIDEYEKYYVGWWNCFSGTSSLPTHNHSGAHFVSVFYFNAHSGNLVLQDPRFNANRGYSPKHQTPFQEIEFTPKTGDVVIFPAYLYHYVKSEECGLRIACSVDVYIKDKKWFSTIESSLKG